MKSVTVAVDGQETRLVFNEYSSFFSPYLAPVTNSFYILLVLRRLISCARQLLECAALADEWQSVIRRPETHSAVICVHFHCCYCQLIAWHTEELSICITYYPQDYKRG